MELSALLHAASAAGFLHAGELKVDTLRFLPEIREMCSADRCRQYGRCWTCPPACGTLEQCEERARGFGRGILVQTVGEMEDSFDFESIKRTESEHKKHFLALVEALRVKEPGILPLGAGACSLCAACTCPDAPCRFPEKAISSMEANGLWVSDVCKKNCIPYNYGENRIAFTSCILAK